MKITILFVLLLNLPFVIAEAQEKQINQTDSEGLRQGYWEQRYPNGNIRYKGHFKDGNPVGELLRYFPDGGKMAVMVFDETGTKASAELFYQNGFPAAKGNYVNEKRDSVWLIFSRHREGLLTARVEYDMGERHGVSEIFYTGGEVSQKLNYRNDLRHGTWKQFYQNGQMKLEGNYENGSREGSFVMYLSDGNKEVEGFYRNNLMHGDWKFYDSNGDHLYTVVYNEGIAENEEELIMKEQELFRFIEQQRGRIPEPDETEMFFNRR